MGRWAQRRIRGGGPPETTNDLARITTLVVGGTDIIAAYTADVIATDFGSGDFTTNPGNFTSTSVNQGDSDTLFITFSDIITFETSLTYTGAVPGVETPQTVTLP